MVTDGNYPAVPEMPPLAGTVGSAALATAVRQVAVAAGMDETLGALTGILIEIHGDGLTLATTDRYRLAVRELPWAPARPAATENVVVPAQVLLSATRTLAADPGQASLFLPLAAADGMAGLSVAGRQLTLRLIDAAFPAYQSRLPQEFTAAAEIPAAALGEAIARVALVAERHTPVWLSFRPGELTIEAGTADRAQATEVLDGIGLEGESGMRVGFSPRYLLDGLGALGTDTARIAFTGATTAAVMTGTARGPMRGTHGLGPQTGYCYVLMPIRVAEQPGPGAGAGGAPPAATRP